MVLSKKGDAENEIRGEGSTVIGNDDPVLGQKSLIQDNLEIIFISRFIRIDKNNVEFSTDSL